MNGKIRPAIAGLAAQADAVGVGKARISFLDQAQMPFPVSLARLRAADAAPSCCHLPAMEIKKARPPPGDQGPVAHLRGSGGRI
jgi:hypothetical protein